jgi:hypothetical protein
MTVLCLPQREKKKTRTLLTLNIDPDVIKQVKEFMRSIDEDNLSAFNERLYLCIMRDSCKGCSSYENLPDDVKVKITGKVGVGHQIGLKQKKEKSVRK